MLRRLHGWMCLALSRSRSCPGKRGFSSLVGLSRAVSTRCRLLRSWGTRGRFSCSGAGQWSRSGREREVSRGPRQLPCPSREGPAGLAPMLTDGASRPAPPPRQRTCFILLSETCLPPALSWGPLARGRRLRARAPEEEPGLSNGRAVLSQRAGGCGGYLPACPPAEPPGCFLRWGKGTLAGECF